MIYDINKCLQRLDYDYRDFFNLPLRSEQILNNCEDCNGRPNGKLCHITLDKLLKDGKVQLVS